MNAHAHPSAYKANHEAAHKGRAVKALFFQPKLAINPPDDHYEQEADATADRVMRMPVQRKCKHCEEEEKQLQRKEENPAIPQVNGGFERYINGLRGLGRPLSADERNFFEPRFNRDFSDVRIHTDMHAAQSAQQINALAYTMGNHIVFNQGQYQPTSANGKRLMAHELTHVVQQGGISGNVQRQSAGPDVERRFGLGMRNRFGLYDAELNRDTNTLTLLMRIKFDFTGAWASDQDQQDWMTDFINHVQNRWSYRFYLVPEGICLNTHETIFARVNVQSVTGNPHYTVEVAAGSRRSSANSDARTARLDALDNDRVTRNRLGQDFQQRASEHEFGHMLGIPHIECDPQTGTCPSGDQYGDTVGERGDLMGSGWIVSARDYTPFTTAMYYFTGCNWKASHTRVYPIGDYPAAGTVSHMA